MGRFSSVSTRRRYRLEFLGGDEWGLTFKSLKAALKAGRTDRRQRPSVITDQRTGKKWWLPHKKERS